MPDPNTVLCPHCRNTNTDGSSTCRHCGSPLPVTAGPTGFVPPSKPGDGFRRGQIFANRYVIQDIIGRGGMGCIYKANDNTLKETIALKTLLPELVRDQVIVERFFNEARIARSLSHPNIVRVHDIGTKENVVYISMEYLKGKSLREILDELTPGQRVGIKTVLRVFDELCAALEYAHRFTVHRDIKPENVMIASDGLVKLMDFGISKLMDHTNLTQASMVMGTPQYMSPEQLRNTSAVDGRADIYSVGVMLYEVITGNIPTGIPKPVSEISQNVPPALDPVIAKCVDPDPDQRYSNARELREALHEVRQLVEAGSDLIQRTAQPPQKPPREWKRPAAIAAAVLAIGALTVAGLGSAERTRKQKLETAAASAALPAQPTTGNTPPPLTIESNDLETWRDLVDDARRRAREIAADPANERTSERMNALIELGMDLARLNTGESEQNPERAIQKLREALPYFLAVAAHPEGMVFIPAGDVEIVNPAGQLETVHVNAFFIDTEPVTNGEFAAFSNRAGWRPMPAGFDPAGPANYTTWYDALAYVSSHKPARALPTIAQWIRTIDYMQKNDALRPWPPGTSEESGMEPVYVRNGLYEWTATTPSGKRPDFRTNMLVAGLTTSATGEFTLTSPPAPYESRVDTIGFRCTYEYPAQPAALRALIAN